ncbi:MAG TPA: peptidylprolyl isomerase [Candidatus Cybelea sp.]|nr:peptidylprolyl isomerase [Candidatus Cybelea sp.]
MKFRQTSPTTSFLFLLLWAVAAPAGAQQLPAARASSSAGGAFANSVPLRPSGRPVALVNGAVLTDRDLLREMYAIFPYARQHNGTFPKAMEPDIRRGALQMIEFEELVYQEALRRKMTIAPARLDEAENSFRQQFPSPEMYRTFLKTECQGSPQALRSKIRRSLLIEDLLSLEVTDKAAVSVAQAKGWFDEHPEQFRIPEAYAVQTISAMAPAKATAQQLKEARQRAEGDLRQAKATKSYQEFGLLAERISDDDFRVMMGDHGLVETAKLPEQILYVVRNMQAGQVSNIVQVEQVFTIVRLNEHVPAGMRKFAEVRDALRQQLKTQNTERLRAGLNRRLRQGAKIEER